MPPPTWSPAIFNPVLASHTPIADRIALGWRPSRHAKRWKGMAFEGGGLPWFGRMDHGTAKPARGASTSGKFVYGLFLPIQSSRFCTT